jgi:hypothetical protein
MSEALCARDKPPRIKINLTSSVLRSKMVSSSGEALNASAVEENCGIRIYVSAIE